MSARRYAEDTSVSIGKSRGEIDDTLRRWGCQQIQWTDDYTKGRARLQFLWEHDGTPYVARFDLELPSEEELRERAIDGRSGKPSESKLRKLMDARGRPEYRQLALWIKACLNAVEAGIIDPEAVFLPWLVGKDGRTVGEVALPNLKRLASGPALKLLEG